jgi:peptidoglycan/LPS O-acetylase OafA/YrhL
VKNSTYGCMKKTQIIDNKNENIEILRAIAIIFTVIFHMAFLLVFPSKSFSWLANHFDFSVGVDLFFVISGFVITRSLSSSFSTSNASKLTIIIAFWIKRLFRLLPAAFFWLLVVSVYYTMIGNFWDGQHIQWKNIIPIAAAFANIYNFYSAYGHANLTVFNIFHICGHYWSLSLEEQFYIVFPWVFIFFRKRLIIGLMVILIILQLFWLRPVWSYGWAFRIDGFCWGILLAFLPVTSGSMPFADNVMKNKIAVFIIAFAFIFLLPFASSHLQGAANVAIIYGVSLVAAISAILVFIAVSGENSFGTWAPYRRLMLYIGSRSYSIYITHFIIYMMVRHLWFVVCCDMQLSDIEKQIANVTIIFLSLFLTVVVSELTYRLIELKFRLKGRELAKNFLVRRQAGVTLA